ncbi:MAG: hypothetical protein EHM42_06685 [Planctomycetaceae bacterium]|nr:MAG: hypothetical protein EHM42_06685 [Planctomycetaceae bacterium]
MSLVLDLPDGLEAELSAEAARAGLSLAHYAVRLLVAGRGVQPSLRSGKELLDYWRDEGLVGTRPEISDAPAHARAIRQQAERRSS